jgi:hypothetical protein
MPNVSTSPTFVPSRVPKRGRAGGGFLQLMIGQHSEFQPSRRRLRLKHQVGHAPWAVGAEIFKTASSTIDLSPVSQGHDQDQKFLVVD